MLAARVASGDLPPVEDRLPDDPLVITPVERVGTYGGTWRQGMRTSPTWDWSTARPPTMTGWSAGRST